MLTTSEATSRPLVVRLAPQRRRRRWLIVLMLVASALVHLAFLALVLLEWRDNPPQGSSPPSVEVMADPQPAADVAAERPPEQPSDKQGEPTASEVPTPPPPPAEAQVPQPPAEAAPTPPPPAEPAPAEPTPAEPVAPPVLAEPAPPTPPAAPEAPPEPPAQTQAAPEPVAPEAVLPPPPQEAAPTAVPRPSPPTVNLNLAPSAPIPPPVLTPPPVPPTSQARRQPAFPAPIVSSWNANPFASHAQRQPRGNNGIDLSLGPVARESRGAPPRGSQDTDAGIRVVGAQVGSDWLRLMQEWWVRHRYYPTQAAANNESGTVQVHLNMDRYGHVHSVRIESTSGSQWLDAGSLSIFRNAQLPPFPSGTLEAQADLHLTLNFYLIRR